MERIRVNLLGPLAAFIRALPVFDAFGDCFIYHTPFPKLFHGKPYEVALPAETIPEVQIPIDKPSPIIGVYNKLKELSGKSPKLKSIAPILEPAWDIRTLFCHMHRFTNDFHVCILPTEVSSGRALPVNWIIQNAYRYTQGLPCVNVVSSVHNPRIPHAYLLRNDDESKHPDLLETMKYVSACCRVITTVQWAVDLAVAYGVPAVYFARSPWKNPYDLKLEVFFREALDLGGEYRVTNPDVEVLVHEWPESEA